MPLGAPVPGRWSEAVTREPGDLLPVVVVCERVGRGAPRRCKSRWDLPHKGRKADIRGQRA